MALPRDESGVQRLGKSRVLFRIADAVVEMITESVRLPAESVDSVVSVSSLKLETKFDVTFSAEDCRLRSWAVFAC
jgi:hypothetical protein